jgi:N-acyl-D-amino-acid deacylase
MFQYATFLFALALFSWVLPHSVSGQPVDADILLRGGTILDGSGQSSYVGDVALRGDRIVAVGSFEPGVIGHSIDCQDLVIAPGFIDLHNHSDDPILQPVTRRGLNYLTQGCTTLVTGNCGGGHRRVARFYDQLEAKGCGVNIAHLLPHGSLREYVMGATRNAPTSGQLARMCDLADVAMREGAWGMSTGLQYVPGAYAELDELAAISRHIAGRGGLYASHIRNEGDQLVESVEEAIAIGRRSGIRVHISHLKASGRRNWGKVRAVAELVEEARADGLQVTADQYPYDASSTSMLAFLLTDAQREGGEQATLARLNDPAKLPGLRASIAAALELRDRLMVSSCKSHPQWIGKLICDIAEADGRAQVDVALDILRVEGARGVNFAMDDNDIRFVMNLPWVATGSDGGSKIDDGTRPHPRSYGTFPRKIGHYAIEKHLLPLEKAIRSATGLPADILQMKGRGYLRPSYNADVVVFDPVTIRDQATYAKPFEHSTGILWVFVNGQAAIAGGQPQEVLAGRALRKPSGPE